MRKPCPSSADVDSLWAEAENLGSPRLGWFSVDCRRMTHEGTQPESNASEPHGPEHSKRLATAAVLDAGRATFLMTAAFEGDRTGVVVSSAMICAEEPLLVSVAVRKGHSIEPIIRDSHTFALCRLEAEGSELLLRKFAEHAAPDEMDDPFVSIPCDTLETGAPVLKRCDYALDCEVVRHFDLEADHELYIGQVLGVRTPSGL